MLKTINSFGHYVLSAEKGKTLFDGETYTKVFISHADIDETVWTEVEDSAVPAVEEITDTEALAILSGGGV